MNSNSSQLDQKQQAQEQEAQGAQAESITPQEAEQEQNNTETQEENPDPSNNEEHPDPEQNPDPVVWFHKGRIKVILTRELIRIQQFGTEQEAEEGMPVIFSGYRTEDVASVRIKDGQFSVYIKHSWLI